MSDTPAEIAAQIVGQVIWESVMYRDFTEVSKVSEPMTPERETEIRRDMNDDYDYGPEERLSGEGQELLAELDRLRASKAALITVLDAAWREAKEQGAKIGILPCAETSLDAMICGIADKYSEQVAALIKERDALELELRKTLWLSHGCIGLYGDDGEMQCARCMIDFKRQTLDEIQTQLWQKRSDRLRAEQRIPPTMTADLLHAIGDAVDFEFPALSQLCQDWEAWLREQPKPQDWKQKIFSHKHLDPRCVESGCRSLFEEQPIPGLPEGMDGGFNGVELSSSPGRKKRKRLPRG